MTALALSLFLLAAPAEPPAVTMVKSKVSDPTQPFVLIVTLKVKSGQEAAFVEAYKVAFPGTKAEAGYLAYELTRSADQPSTYVLYEKWKSVDALSSHMTEAHTVTFLKAIGECTEGAELKVMVPVK